MTGRAASVPASMRGDVAGELHASARPARSARDLMGQFPLRCSATIFAGPHMLITGAVSASRVTHCNPMASGPGSTLTERPSPDPSVSIAVPVNIVRSVKGTMGNVSPELNAPMMALTSAIGAGSHTVPPLVYAPEKLDPFREKCVESITVTAAQSPFAAVT